MTTLMRVDTTSEEKENIISLQRDFFRVGEINEEFQRTFEIHFSADLIRAFTKGCLKLQIKAYTRSPDINFSILGSDAPVNELSKQLQLKSKILQNRWKNRASSVVLRKTVALSSAINDAGKVPFLKTGNTNSLFGLLPERNLIRIKPMATKNMLSVGNMFSVTVPAAQASCNVPEEKELAAPDAAENTMNLAILKNVDPVGVFNSKAYAFPIEPAELKLQGLSPSIAGYAGSPPTNANTKAGPGLISIPPTSKPVSKVSINSLGAFTSPHFPAGVNLPNIKADLVTSFTSRKLRGMPQLIERVRTRQSVVPFAIPVVFLVDEKKLRGYTRINFEFIVFDEKNIVKQRIVRPVNLRAAFIDAGRIYTPPTVGAATKSVTSNTITITQEDPSGVGADLYKKVIDQSVDENRWSAGRWVYMGHWGVTPSKSITITDVNVSSTKTTMYRACAVSDTKDVTKTFGSAIVEPSSRAMVSPVITEDTNNRGVMVTPDAILSARSVSDGVKLTAHRTTSSVNSILKIFAAERRSDAQAGASVRMPIDTNTMIHRARSGRTYEYTTELRLVDGTTAAGKSTLVHKHLARNRADEEVRENIGTMAISVKNTGIDNQLGGPGVSQNIGVNFSISVSNWEESFDSMVGSIASMIGAKESFMKQIEEQRSRYRDLLRLSIDRHDLISGLSENFNMINTDIRSWSDNHGSRRTFAISAPAPGGSYLYKFRVLRLSIGELLSNVTFDETDQETLIKFQKLAKTEGNEDPLKGNTTKSEKESQVKKGAESDSDRNGLANLFVDSPTTIYSEVKVDIPLPTYTVKNITAKASSDGRDIMIRWSGNGNASMVDSFIVMGEYDGVKAPIGTTLIDRNGGSSIKDTVLGGIVGVRSYSVIPVFNDFSKGRESDSVQVRIENNLVRGEGVR
tara:strand:- start:9130 stop:11862 length:2733 start_codon:yes stop_codon:yes gene_type:complete